MVKGKKNPFRDRLLVSQVWSGFEHLPYVACRSCDEYTRKDSSALYTWLEYHSACDGGFQFFAEHPKGYSACLNWMEELARAGRE